MGKNFNIKFIRLLIVFLLVLGAIGASILTYLFSFVSEISDKPYSSNEPTAVNPIKMEAANILILGTDTGTPGSSDPNDPKRTDTMMVVHYDPKLERIFVVSIPRDTKIKYKNSEMKINASNAIGGVKLVTSSVEQLLGIKINYYVELNYTAFHKTIDAINGIKLTIPQTMKYDDPSQNLHINFKKGEIVNLDGQKAEEFFRWRKNNEGLAQPGGGSDLSRIQNQKVLLKAVIDKISSLKIVTEIPGITKIISENVSTNLSGNDIIDYVVTFAKLGNSKIDFETIKGDTPDYLPGEPSYFVYEPKKNIDVVAALNGELYLNRQDIHVNIINISGINNLASKVKSNSVDFGYHTYNIKTASGKSEADESKIEVFGIDDKYDETLKRDFNIKNLIHSENEKKEFDIIVTLGKDYIYKEKN